MYCYYVAKSTWTQLDLINDVAALCTGADVSSLSASCDKTLSYQTGSTIAAGWTMYDSDTAQTTKGVVLSSPDADGLTTKYYNIFGSGTNLMATRVVEAWDINTNTATNASNQNNSTIGTLGTGFIMYVFVTPQYIHVQFNAISSVGCIEISRDTLFLQSASPQPLVGVGTTMGTFSSGSGYLPRVKLPTTGATATGATAIVKPALIGLRYTSAAMYAQPPQAGPLYDSNNNQLHSVHKMYWGWGDSTNGGYAHFGATEPNVNGRAPLFARISITGANHGDILVVDGFNYVYLAPTYGILFPLE